jgi:light-regulated signal transduction histidine kinase (bacteriophytochrome)
MGQLIDDLLDFSRLTRQPLNRRLIPTGELVRQVLDDLRGEHAGRDVVMRVGDLPPCEADAAMLRQVFMNLFTNALKYTRKRETAEVEVGAVAGGQAGELPVYFVRDNGVGFDMRYAHKLFGVFQRLHPAEEYEGTGVGLALVERIITRHGGRIWAEAEPGRGAAFYFTLAGRS